MWEVSFNPQSILEIDDALNYYQNLSPGAARTFFQEVKRAVLVLRKNPYYQIRYKKVRCFPLKRFPFMLHFEMDEENVSVRILGWIHTSLHPDKNWR